jgi:hypothetical protein
VPGHVLDLAVAIGATRNFVALLQHHRSRAHGKADPRPVFRFTVDLGHGACQQGAAGSMAQLTGQAIVGMGVGRTKEQRDG